MEIETLRLFLDVWKAGNITSAANYHYITQSALSKKIAVLENELGVQIFSRGKGRLQVSLTPAGKELADIAERILLLYGQAQELKYKRVRRFLTIACIRSAHDGLLPRLLNHIRGRKPDFCISIEDHHTTEILSLLEKRRIDLGIGQAAASNLNFISELLYEEEYRVVTRANRLYADDAAVHPRQLPSAQGIFQAFDQEFQDWYEQWWGFFAARIRVNTTPTAEQYFTEPGDWMIVPSVVAQAMEKRGFFSYPLVPEAQAPKHRVFLLYNKKQQNMILDDFLAELKAAAKQCGIG